MRRGGRRQVGNAKFFSILSRSLKCDARREVRGSDWALLNSRSNAFSTACDPWCSRDSNACRVVAPSRYTSGGLKLRMQHDTEAKAPVSAQWARGSYRGRFSAECRAYCQGKWARRLAPFDGRRLNREKTKGEGCYDEIQKELLPYPPVFEPKRRSRKTLDFKQKKPPQLPAVGFRRRQSRGDRI